MRLLIVGTLNGQLTTATKIAMDKGATVTHAADNSQAVAVLRSGRGADLLMVDVANDIRDLVARLEAEHIHAPIVACGIATDARAAVAAIHAGAKEYIPLPPDAELIAAVLAAVADDRRELIYRDDAMARVVKLALQVAPHTGSVNVQLAVPTGCGALLSSSANTVGTPVLNFPGISSTSTPTFYVQGQNVGQGQAAANCALVVTATGFEVIQYLWPTEYTGKDGVRLDYTRVSTISHDVPDANTWGVNWVHRF